MLRFEAMPQWQARIAHEHNVVHQYKGRVQDYLEPFFPQPELIKNQWVRHYLVYHSRQKESGGDWPEPTTGITFDNRVRGRRKRQYYGVHSDCRPDMRGTAYVLAVINPPAYNQWPIRGHSLHNIALSNRHVSAAHCAPLHALINHLHFE